MRGEAFRHQNRKKAQEWAIETLNKDSSAAPCQAWTEVPLEKEGQEGTTEGKPVIGPETTNPSQE